jgi:hexokinase
MKTPEDFLKELGIHVSQVDLKDVVESFTNEMVDGLVGKSSSLKMYPSRIGIEEEAKHDGTVLAIDAGGTNFRAALVRFNDWGKPVIDRDSGIVKCKMPGIDGELSKDDFFGLIVDKLSAFQGKYDKIGFCFSYPTEMREKAIRNGYGIIDGKLEKWTKGIKAPEVVGEMIGSNLLHYLGVDKELVVVNDTVAALMAGKGEMPEYDSYIGFILGTGTNTSYIEQNINIKKELALNGSKSQVINIESGNFNKIILTEIDKELDRIMNKQLARDSKDLGSQVFEKMISGRYLGEMIELVLKKAAEKDCFMAHTNHRIMAKETLLGLDKTEIAGYYISHDHPVDYLFSTIDDKFVATEIIKGVMERAAAFVGCNLAAVILKSGKGNGKGSAKGKGSTSEEKVLIVSDGSTFFKFEDYKITIEKYIRKSLSAVKERRFFEINVYEIDDINLKGAAIAAVENV